MIDRPTQSMPLSLSRNPSLHSQNSQSQNLLTVNELKSDTQDSSLVFSVQKLKCRNEGSHNRTKTQGVRFGNVPRRRGTRKYACTDGLCGLGLLLVRSSGLCVGWGLVWTSAGAEV